MRFGKPVLLPATTGLYIDKGDDGGWDLSLRNIAKSWPYMHNGSLPTLQAVVMHYTGGFVARPGLATHINPTLRLSAQEKGDLIAFLRTLSSEPGPTHPKRAGPD